MYMYSFGYSVVSYRYMYIGAQCMYKCVHTSLSHPFPISVVVVGFAQSTYTFSEASGAVQVCVQLREGQLGTELSLQVHTHSGTAQGDCIFFWFESR